LIGGRRRSDVTGESSLLSVRDIALAREEVKVEQPSMVLAVQLGKY
jgi:hypothetical protein